MTPVFNIELTANNELKITDTSYLNNVYLPEEETDQLMIMNAFINGKFKYSGTITINAIEYRNGSSETELKTIIRTPHDNQEDIASYQLDKDGTYIIHHIILPTQLLIEEIEEFQSFFNLPNLPEVYYVDLNNIIRKRGSSDTISVYDIINNENRTISKCSKTVFSIGYLHKCYIDVCKEIFKLSDVKCSLTTDLLSIFKRDFLWMTINILKYYTSLSKYHSAQHLLEDITKCGGFCNKTNTPTNSYDCGCNK